jgi:hypothetical protein
LAGEGRRLAVVKMSFGFSFDLDPLIGGLFEKKP